jgi:amino acid transporter
VSFIGFEAAALYGEETANPRRTVPRATYLSVVLITAFYTLVSWAAVGGVGVDRLRPTAEAELGDLFFNLAGRYLNDTVASVMQILLCVSMFGTMLALHNAANRYMYVLGRDRVLPAWLGRAHPVHGSPHRASLTQIGVTVAVCAAFALAGLDPYVNLATTMLGLGTLGIVVLQGAAAVSVLGFFRRRPDRHWWRTGLAPLLALAGLGTATVLLVTNFSVVTGSHSPIVNRLPWLMPIALVGGIAYGWWLRISRPDRYARLAATPLRDSQDETPRGPQRGSPQRGSLRDSHNESGDSDVESRPEREQEPEATPQTSDRAWEAQR